MESAREQVAVLFRFSRVKVCVVVGYGPNEGNAEERDDLDRIVDRVRNGYRLFVLGDLNRWIGDRVKSGRSCAFGVPGENNNERRVVESFAERGLCAGNG